MSLNFLTDSTLDDRRTGSSSDYPYGTYKDKEYVGGVLVSGTGTPLIKRILSDWDGVRQAILAAGKVTPDGDPDTVLDCEVLDALLTMYGKVLTLRNASSTAADYEDNSSVELDPDDGKVEVVNGLGTSYNLKTSIEDGGIKFSGTRPGVTTSDGLRIETFQHSSAALTQTAVGTGVGAASTEITAISVIKSDVDLELVGIPIGAQIQAVDLFFQNTALTKKYKVPVGFKLSESASGWAKIERLCGWFADYAVGISAASVYVQIQYDPTAVD